MICRGTRTYSRTRYQQHGAVMVEFAITLALFMVLLLAIFEFVLMIMAFSRANEATREVARQAVIRVPDSIDVPGAGYIDDDDDFYRALAGRQLPAEWIDNVRIEYGSSDIPDSYTVTVSLDGAEYEFFAPTLLGLSPTIGVPSFTTSRLSENLDTD